MEILHFSSAANWRAWLAKNYDKLDGIRLRIYKKASGVDTVTYAEALDQALCFGWIDGKKLPGDEKSWLQTFTPRRPRSKWSKRNTEHVERLIASHQMAAPGLKEVEAAKKDSRWQEAYDSFANTSIPSDFMEKLKTNEKALIFFETLNKTNRYAIAYRLQTAKKPQTREKRMEMIIEMLARSEKFH
jgi:uncharacterized protein YdeI (YjbR/CyaY-like superfamily)